MSDPTLLVGMASAGTLAISAASAAGLRAWHAWLDLERARLAAGRSRGGRRAPEINELRERVKRLEAIANG